MTKFLHIGGLVAAGFDPISSYLLTITHSGRGVFSTESWQRVARDYQIYYPQKGRGIGIGPIDGQVILVTELNSDCPCEIVSSDGRFKLECESSGINVIKDCS